MGEKEAGLAERTAGAEQDEHRATGGHATEGKGVAIDDEGIRKSTPWKEHDVQGVDMTGPVTGLDWAGLPPSRPSGLAGGTRGGDSAGDDDQGSERWWGTHHGAAS